MPNGRRDPGLPVDLVQPGQDDLQNLFAEKEQDGFRLVLGEPGDLPGGGQRAQERGRLGAARLGGLCLYASATFVAPLSAAHLKP